MPSAPKNNKTDRSKAAMIPVIRMGDDEGSEPTDAEETDALIRPVLHINAGWKQPNRCELVYDMGRTGERLQNTQTPVGYARRIHLCEPATAKDTPDRVFWWGELSQVQQVLDGDGQEETMNLVFEISKHHFGSPLLGEQYRRPTGSHDTVQHHGPITFNPEIDGKVENNRSNYTEATHEWHFWVHPESTRTGPARTYGQDGDSTQAWTLAQAVHSLCWACNPDEEFIDNPELKYLNQAFSQAPDVRDVQLPPGLYLCDLLDQLLTPLGYSWYVETFDTGGVASVPLRLQFFQLGEGKATQVHHPEISGTVSANAKNANTPTLRIVHDIANLANKITVLGAYVEREVTIELYRGWPEADDALSAEDLDRSTGSQFAGHQAAWRMWVANEAGDYCGTRTTVAPIPTTPLDLTGVLGADTIPRRRVIGDCITIYDDEQSGTRRRREPFAQWYNEDNEWKPVPTSWGLTILQDQGGIYFAADSPPAELIARAANARIRITGTMRGDLRLIEQADREDSSPQLNTIESVLTLSDRFFDRQVQTTGDYASVLAGVPDADDADDATDAEEYAEKMRDIEDAALIQAELRLAGIHYQYKIGHLIDKVRGRDLSLNRKSTKSSTKRYLQVMGITYDFHRQTTVLRVEAIDTYAEAL